MTALLSLFAGSVLASTLMPGGVEVLLYYQLHFSGHSWISLLVVATAGNTLGGIITYLMGVLLRKGVTGSGWHKKAESLFRIDDKSTQRIKRWGVPTLFFSWLPIIGDPLCLAGGYLRLPVWPSVSMIFFGKFMRYCMLLWIYMQPWASAPV